MPLTHRVEGGWEGQQCRWMKDTFNTVRTGNPEP